MKKVLAFGLVGAAALGMGGCGTVVGTYIANGVSGFEDFVTSPKTAATLTVLSKATIVVICDISAVSNVAGQVEVAAGAGKSTIGTNGKVYAASTAACTGLSGLDLGLTTVPAGTTVVTAAAPVGQ